MNLSANYKYLFLDFETTGLDVSSDFPIQIALIETDHNLKVLQSYTSYISLPESIKRLRSNVSYMTGIDIETIESQGKSLETIQSEIADFFGEDIVLIGQNISFDIGFLKKFFAGSQFSHSIDTYPLAASSIPYLKSYSLESIDNHLSTKYESYKDQKEYFLTQVSKEKTLSAHDALYDCVSGLCFISRWQNQLNILGEQFPILYTTLSKTQGEGISTILQNIKIQGEDNNLPILTSPLIEHKIQPNQTVVNREKTSQHSKWSTKGVNLSTLIAELPHPCIIAVSHGSKIDIIKRACKDESFNFLKEEQILDQEKLSLWLSKEIYTEEEFLFVLFYLSHHRDGYRILHPTLTTHKYILDYLQVKNINLKKDKKILCSHGGLYYTIQNNPERKETYKDYPICILDADRRHTTYNDYAQKGIGLTTILSQWEKFEYESKQSSNTKQSYSESIENIINGLTFFIAHFTKDSEKLYNNMRQYKREIDYLLNHQGYTNTSESWSTIREQRNGFTHENKNIPSYLTDTMNKLSNFFQNPLKIQRNINQNKDVYYTISPAVRYIDFAEYLRMFGDHKVLFFSPARSEYTTFLPSENTKKIPIIYEENIEKILTTITNSTGSVFIISHNSEKSKKIFAALHESELEQTHTLIGEHLTGGIAKNAIKQTSDKPNIIIGGYHMLLHFWGEGNKIDHIIISYIHQNMKSFINDDIQQYGL